MKNNLLVNNYKSILSIKETELAIKLVKDTFERKLAEKLCLLRVSAPIFVEPNTGLNDNLNGYEKAVGFNCIETGTRLEIVHSLAKWKRNALAKYSYTGLYTDMNAIRPYEDLDNLHSLYVDQWDWEKTITKEQRNEEFLKQAVRDIYQVLLDTYKVIIKEYPQLTMDLPNDITFITTEELLAMYPNMTNKQRENEIAKKHKAVFLMHIGDKLANGEPHDGRAADYDDWSLNGDILIWYDLLGIAFELSSMGIRVDADSLKSQLAKKDENYKLQYKYHQDVINGNLPLTIGGGIGQSRLCMLLLHKAHIGEVQASYWSNEDIQLFEKNNIILL